MLEETGSSRLADPPHQRHRSAEDVDLCVAALLLNSGLFDPTSFEHDLEFQKVATSLQDC